MRSCIPFCLVAIFGCQSAATPRAVPSVEVRREPNNRAALDLDGMRSLLSGRERSSPPEEPVAPPAAIGRCLRSRMCGFEGLCSSLESGLCVAATNADCAPSNACLGGRCTATNGVCIAASDEDCRGSWACRGWGRCFHDGQEACSAKRVDDCLASTRCQREGECTLAGDVCTR